MLRMLLLIVLVLPLAPPAAAVPEPIQIPLARVGDRWSVDIANADLRYDLEVTPLGDAIDRWGRRRQTYPVRVEGFSPLSFIWMRVTRHHLHLDAASGVQIADVAEGVFDAGPSGTSTPGAYSTFWPNDTEAWPGWTLAGGLLAGRQLVPGSTIEVPLAVTRTRGNERITLETEEIPPSRGARCARATGTAVYPQYFAYRDGITSDRGELRVSLEIVHCDDSPFAVRVRNTYSGAFDHSVEASRIALDTGNGEAVPVGALDEPETHRLAARRPFDGSMEDGGPLEIFGIEAAQDAAMLAPGLAAWRVAHPAAYLVEAEYIPARLDEPGATAGVGADRWRLTYAAPAGAQHQVSVEQRAGAAVPIDLPQATTYPVPVPPLATWPQEVVTPAGAIASWRQLAGAGARLNGLKWQPLLDHRWHVLSELPFDCPEDPCSTALSGLDLMFDVVTGATQEGLHPLGA